MNSSLITLLVIFMLIANCLSQKCWPEAESGCQNHMCDKFHILRRYDSNSNQSVQTVCPKSDGHDVVLCEHPSFTGDCYTTHIPEGKNCANVAGEINNLATAVDTLGGCIRFYDEANCRGEMLVLHDSNGYLSKLNDMVSSVGLCTPEDKPSGGCNQASPEGRKECIGNQCYKLDDPNCGEHCGYDHFMWSGNNHPICRNQSSKFCCPKSEGHDVVLCEHPSYEGKCYTTHIPRGKNCANVANKINNLATAVHTLGGCIRLYDDANCHGKMLVLHHSTTYLSELNDMVSSVGLCTPEDRPKIQGCYHAAPEGRVECLSNRCYWLGSPNCGDSSTCGHDHLMWSGTDYPTCRNQSTKFCCPKSEGHDVVLCEHPNFTGECYTTHIPKGKNCANVARGINNLATAVHTLGGCIRLYDEANCRGEMLVLHDSNGYLSQLNDRVSSVGLCTPEEQSKRGCNQGAPEGRIECLNNRCYWLNSPNCEENRTCGQDLFMWSGDNYPTCGNRSTKLCCPSSEGHEVVLCEHPDFTGECYITHIPEGKNCANVVNEVNNLATAIHTFGGCVRLYDEADCRGQMHVLHDSNSYLSDLNDRVSSVGLCTPEDRPRG